MGFLRAVEAERLYLVGDIIDGWELERGAHWPSSHQAVVEELLHIGRSGTQLIYVTGNHDEELRSFHGRRFGALECIEERVHTCADGRASSPMHSSATMALRT